MLGLDSPIHWLLVLLVILLVFGTKKLRNIGSDLGAAVKGFKEGVKGGDEEKAAAARQAIAPQVADNGTINVDVKEKSRS